MPDERSVRWLRFLIGGGINTAFTYAVYLALHSPMDYQWAYFFAYAAGVLFSYWFNARVVFKVPLSWRGLATYPIVYLVQYAASALFLVGLVEYVNIDERIAPLAVTTAMVPLTYVMSKLVLNFSNYKKTRV